MFIHVLCSKSIPIFIGSLPQFFLVLGILVNAILGLYLATLDYWRIFFALSLVPVVIQILGFGIMVESPNALIQWGKIEEARAALQRLRGTTDVGLELSILLSGSRLAPKPSDVKKSNYTGVVGAEGANVGTSLQSTENAETPSLQEKPLTIWRLLRTPALQKSLQISFMLQFMQQLVGINVVTYYSTKILADSFPNYASLLNVMLQVVNLLFTALGTYLMDRTGRRPLLLSSLFLTLIFSCLFIAGSISGIKVLKVVSVFAYSACFSYGLGMNVLSLC